MKQHLLLSSLLLASLEAWALPAGFIYVDEQIPDIVVELRYRGQENFLGQPVDGYLGERAILSQAAAHALAGVQQDLRPLGLGIKIFDAYRPQRAVDHFVRWAQDIGDTKMKASYYPEVDKRNLFKEDYIAERSGHSRGSTVDLTLIALDGHGTPLDMGTGFDFFGPASWPDHTEITAQQRANRLLLRTLMQKHGFKPYAREWWHFTLATEPYPDTYFDFLVE